MESRWRAHARPIIAAVIAAHPEADEATLRKLISAEYPFGERAMHPYDVWCSEVRAQLDLHFGRGEKAKTQRAEAARDEAQGALFEEVA